ncbi:MAG: hypothetical protein ABSA93_27480 [Streptosporangiaceae bacterium]|jgi:hypothetical protein
MSRKRKRRSVRIVVTVTTVALVGTISAACSARTIVRSASITPQVKDLEGRVDHEKYFTKCVVPAEPTAGAEATIKCQARQPGLNVSASSFKVTGDAIPFSVDVISEESPGLNAFLENASSGGLPVLPADLAASSVTPCSPHGVAACPDIGYSGFWGSPGLVIGRLYCYKKSSSYYIVWTFDNDSYEASYNEDFVVVASGDSLTSLVRWWRQVPV